MKNSYFVRPGLVAELRNKRDTLVHVVSDETGLHSALLEAAHLEASYHSKITEPDQAVRSRKIGRKRDFRETKGLLLEARDYAKSNFNGEVTQPFVIGLANILQPSIGGYRSHAAHISGYNHSGVNPAKIPEQMDALVNLVNNKDLDPVERAILFQLHFLRIHPFADGNGRTGRFVQNTILAHNKYAPAILSPAERSFYNDLIHAAQVGFKEREAQGDIRAPELMAIPPIEGSPESRFIHYVATKVNVGMDQLIGDYENLAKYKIEFFGFRNPDEIKGIKTTLVRHLAHTGKPFHVGFTDPKRGTITLSVDSNDGEIARFLNGRTPLRYRIVREDS